MIAKVFIDALEYQLSEAAKIIQFMLPFLDGKAAESGDVAGIQLNARQFISQLERTRAERDSRKAEFKSASATASKYSEF
jgi:hypothetical protein